MPSQSGPTLTQRRTGVKQVNSVGDQPTPPPPRKVDGEEGAVVKIIIWGVVILATGIGLALLVRNLTATDTPADNTQEDTVAQQETNDTADTVEEEETIQEEETVEEEQKVEEPVVEEEKEETTETPSATNTSGEFSQEDQTVTDNLTTNSVTLGGYEYATYADKFVYTLKFENTTKYPTVTASLNEADKTLTLVANNISKDNIVGGLGSGSTEFADPRNVEYVDIKNSGSQTTFVFQLKKLTDYRLFKVDDKMNVTLEVKNS